MPTLRGGVVRAATLPATAPLPARRGLPGVRRLPLPQEQHVRDAHGATAGLSAALPARQRDGGRGAHLSPVPAAPHHDDQPHAPVPAALRLRRYGLRRTGMSPTLSAGWGHERGHDDRLSPAVRGEFVGSCAGQHAGPHVSPLSAAVHRRHGVSDDRLPCRTFHAAPVLPDVHGQQPLLPLSRGARQRLTRPPAMRAPASVPATSALQ